MDNSDALIYRNGNRWFFILRETRQHFEVAGSLEQVVQRLLDAGGTVAVCNADQASEFEAEWWGPLEDRSPPPVQDLLRTKHVSEALRRFMASQDNVSQALFSLIGDGEVHVVGVEETPAGWEFVFGRASDK